MKLENMPYPTSSPTRFVVHTPRRRIIRMSTSGSGWRGLKAHPDRQHQRCSREQPEHPRRAPAPRVPWLTPSSREANPIDSSPAPAQSILVLSLRTGDTGTKKWVITAAKAMTIAATQKIHS